MTDAGWACRVSISHRTWRLQCRAGRRSRGGCCPLLWYKEEGIIRSHQAESAADAQIVQCSALYSILLCATKNLGPNAPLRRNKTRQEMITETLVRHRPFPSSSLRILFVASLVLPRDSRYFFLEDVCIRRVSTDLLLVSVLLASPPPSPALYLPTPHHLTPQCSTPPATSQLWQSALSTNCISDDHTQATTQPPCNSTGGTQSVRSRANARLTSKRCTRDENQ